MINFTFIIPHHNTPDLLLRLLNSIPKRIDTEIIVVDDNSDEEKKPHVNRDDMTVYYIGEKDSRGAGKARNIGLSKAKGKWILFADSDDFFTSELNYLMEKHLSSPADIIFFNTDSVLNSNVYQHYDSSRCKEFLFNHYEKTNDLDVFRYMYKEPWGKMFNRDFLNKHSILFDETPVANDYFFSVKSGCLAQNLEIDSEILYIVTHREGSLSFKTYDTKEKLIARVNVTLKVQIFLEEKGYVFRPMLINSLMKVLLKRYPILFIKTLMQCPNKSLDKLELLKEMFLSSKILKRHIYKKSHFPNRIR